MDDHHDGPDDPKGGFKDHGEYLTAVMMAGSGRIDPRLLPLMVTPAEALHVRFTRSTTTHRLHRPPRRGDFIAGKYYTGRRWVRQSKKWIQRERR